jgi:hypothetical protein
MDNHQEHHHGAHCREQLEGGESSIGNTACAGSTGSKESEMDELERRLFERAGGYVL